MNGDAWLTVLGGLLAGGVGVLVWRFQFTQTEKRKTKVLAIALAAEAGLIKDLVENVLEQCASPDAVLEQIKSCTHVYKANSGDLGLFKASDAQKVIEYYSFLGALIHEQQNSPRDLGEIVKHGRFSGFIEAHGLLYADLVDTLNGYT